MGPTTSRYNICVGINFLLAFYLLFKKNYLIVLVLLFAQLERLSVFRMQDFFVGVLLSAHLERLIGLTHVGFY